MSANMVTTLRADMGLKKLSGLKAVTGVGRFDTSPVVTSDCSDT